MEITLNSSNFNETIKSEEKILVDFWATWCGPCMRQAPILEELAGEGYHIGKVDVDQAPDLAGNYRVMSIPTLILFKNGEEVKRFIGLQTKDTLKALLDAEQEAQSDAEQSQRSLPCGEKMRRLPVSGRALRETAAGKREDGKKTF